MKWLIPLLLVATPTLLFAEQERHYLADMHESRWDARTNKLYCELTHIIPRYGVARFKKPAGEEISFRLSTFNESNRKQAIAIDSTIPEWRHYGGEKTLGNGSENGSNVPLSLPRSPTLRLLYELESGMRPTFSYKDAADATQLMTVSLSSVNFRPAHQAFNYCVAQLLPFGFDDIKFTKVNFDFNSDKINPEMSAKVDKLIRYVKADRKVKKIIVGGHTDWVGSELYNDDLSQFRTYRVVDYLTANGIPESLIQYSSHGERKPLRTNKTDSGRAANRRVTLEVIRINDDQDNL